MEQDLVICKKCEEYIFYEEEDVHWDEDGAGYSTKLVQCPVCGAWNIICYVEDDWLHETN